MRDRTVVAAPRRVADYLGLTDTDRDWARAVHDGGAWPPQDKFLTVRVDDGLHQRVAAAAAQRGLSVSGYLRALVDADLDQAPGELGSDVRDALRRLVEAYHRSTA